MNLAVVTPNLTLSLCFHDLLIEFAPDYDLRENKFLLDASDQKNENNTHLKNMSVQELVAWAQRLDINELFRLRAQISSKSKVDINCMRMYFFSKMII